MKIKTKQHFKKLIDIIKKEGFIGALDYNYQIIRSKNNILNWLFEGVDYLKKPSASWYGKNIREHYASNYTVTYSSSGKLLKLECK